MVFVTLALWLFILNVQAWDEFPDDSPFGFMDWGDGSRVKCTFGFNDTTIQASPPSGNLLTISISLKAGKTLTCSKVEDNGTSQSGQAILLTPLQITGVQDLGCTNVKGGASQKIFEATCGKNGADVTGKIQWVAPSDAGLLGQTYEFGGAATLNTGACNPLFPKVAGTFDRNVIFANTEGWNAPSCQGDGNHGPLFFRGCSATGLGKNSACTDTVHTGGTGTDPKTGGIRQLLEFGLICRTPFNTSSCAGTSDPSGVIQTEIDCTTIDCSNIIQSSLTCGAPDNPFTEKALDVKPNGGNLVVKCHRCVASPAAELVVAGQTSDGSEVFVKDIGGLCTGEPTSR